MGKPGSAVWRLLLAMLRWKRKQLRYQRLPQKPLPRMQQKHIVGVYQCYVKHRAAQRARRWWVRPLLQDHDTHGAWATLIPSMRQYDTEKFYNFMRMTPAMFDKLLGMVTSAIQKHSWRKYVSPGERLAITLRYVATGDSARSLSFLFRVSHQCISKILLETTTVIYVALEDIVYPKLTEETWLRIAAEFEAYWDLPHCVGAIDGRHSKVRAFPHCGSRLFNYKKFHSLITMAVVDAKHRLIIFQSGFSGRRGDGNVFHHSELGCKMSSGQFNFPPACAVDGLDVELPFFLVGDNAFERTVNMMTPFKGQFLDHVQRIFNLRISRARQISENAFGLMCTQFEILHKGMRGSEELCKSILLCTGALHNFHLLEEDSIPISKRRYLPAGFVDRTDSNGSLVYGRWRNECPLLERTCLQKLQMDVEDGDRDSHDRLSGKEVAYRLMEYFIDNPLPWQYKQAGLL